MNKFKKNNLPLNLLFDKQENIKLFIFNFRKQKHKTTTKTKQQTHKNSQNIGITSHVISYT